MNTVNYNKLPVGKVCHWNASCAKGQKKRVARLFNSGDEWPSKGNGTAGNRPPPLRVRTVHGESKFVSLVACIRLLVFYLYFDF